MHGTKLPLGYLFLGRPWFQICWNVGFVSQTRREKVDMKADSRRNAGLFIWLDLRDLLSAQTHVGSTEESSTSADMYKAYELRVLEICSQNGVMIAPGHVYMSEEYGWFRITFTIDPDALQEGLARLHKSLIQLAE